MFPNVPVGSFCQIRVGGCVALHPVASGCTGLHIWVRFRESGAKTLNRSGAEATEAFSGIRARLRVLCASAVKTLTESFANDAEIFGDPGICTNPSELNPAIATCTR